jgi:hypothetical protein
LLFTVTSASLPLDIYFFKLTQPLTGSTVELLYAVKEKGGKPDRKPYPLPYGLRNPYRNLSLRTLKIMPENLNKLTKCMFMNSASGLADTYEYVESYVR